MTRTSRPLLWLLPLGLALGHLLGNLFGDHAGAPALDAGRSVFAALGLVGVPLAGWAATRLFRAGRSRTPLALSGAVLILTQVAAFLAIEMVEHLVTGVPLGRLFAHPGLWWAVLGQIVVASLVARAARLAVAVGEASGAGADRAWPATVAADRPALLDDVRELLVSLGSAPRRGPPLTAR